MKLLVNSIRDVRFDGVSVLYSRWYFNLNSGNLFYVDECTDVNKILNIMSSNLILCFVLTKILLCNHKSCISIKVVLPYRSS